MISSYNFSVIIPVYNRCSELIRSLHSVHPLASSCFVEVIVIDDCSTDSLSLQYIQKSVNTAYYGAFKYIRLPVNMGVTFAKNAGGMNATCDWLIFLDSDDILVERFGDVFSSEMHVLPNYGKIPDILFFRSISRSTLKLIGPPRVASHLNLEEFLRHGTYGECLPVIKRASFLVYPYNSRLRGCESTAYLNLLVNDGSFYLSDKIGRVYTDTGSSRLSSPLNLFRRSRFLVIYHASFFVVLLRSQRIFYPLALLKALFYFMCSFVVLILGLFSVVFNHRR
jgi:glycosyltransferase involved in cell wall biosynthesis